MQIRIDQALTDKRLLGAALGDQAKWATWRVALKAAFGLELNDEEAVAFSTIAGGRRPPGNRVRELWAVVGRRGGKSRMAAAIAVYLAAFVKHKLAPGEVGMVLVLAASTAQATTVFEYVRGFLNASPALRKEIVAANRTELTLRNGITIGIHANSFRTIRGRTLVGCVLDEISFWRDESSANPDLEVYRALLPALATCNGFLCAISTPYRKTGLLHQKHKEYFGVSDDEILVVQGASVEFNPQLSAKILAAQRAADPTSAVSEWDAEFRQDISAFLDDELIEAATDHGRPLELPPMANTFYRAFVDASGGTGNDAYSIAIGHKASSGEFAIDVCRGTRGRIDPQATTEAYAKLCKEYRVGTVIGDSYSAEWVKTAWRSNNVTYVKSDLPKSQIYIETIPLFTRGLVRLPNQPTLLRELRLLERHTHRSGRDTVDHGKGGHDDYANAVCGVLRQLSNRLGYDYSYSGFSDNPSDGSEGPSYLQQKLNAYILSGGTIRQ